MRRIKIFPSRVPTGSLIIICQDVSIVTMDFFDSDEQTDKFKTYNMRFKGGYQLTPWLKINNNFEFSHNKYYNPITYSEGSGVVWRNIADEDTRHRHCSTLMVR